MAQDQVKYNAIERRNSIMNINVRFIRKYEEEEEVVEKEGTEPSRI